MILCYHAVEPEWDSPLAVDPTAFEEQCAWLAANRRVLALDDAVEALDDRFLLPRGSTAITFDDGFRSTHEHAFPILHRHGLPMTVFVVAGTLTPQGRRVDWVDTPPAWPLRTLELAQLREMLASGLVRVGSHSLSHRRLPQLSFGECVEDLRRSRELLEELLGVPVDHLAYPRGEHDATVRRSAAEAGYRFSFALPRGREPRGAHAVPRVGIYPGNDVGALRVKTTRWYVSLRTSPLFPLVRRLAGRGGWPSPAPG